MKKQLPIKQFTHKLKGYEPVVMEIWPNAFDYGNSCVLVELKSVKTLPKYEATLVNAYLRRIDKVVYPITLDVCEGLLNSLSQIQMEFIL